MSSKATTQNTVIAVVGPTAVGKTALAIQLATRFQTEILSADSRQCYKELAIGVARPAESELHTTPHHFIASHTIHSVFTAADYESYALHMGEELFRKHDRLVLVGGTGLYIRTFLEGLDSIPEVDAAIRTDVIELYQQHGIEGLEAELHRLDQQYVKEGEMRNPQRMMRALEVVMSTSKSILTYRTGTSKPRDFSVKWVGLELPRAVLIDRIDRRVDEMFEAGLVEEARALYPYRELNALQTVGYKELFEHFDGKYTLSEAIERIKIATRQYAKRQMTWFKRIPEIRWFAPHEEAMIIDYLSAEDSVS